MDFRLTEEQEALKKEFEDFFEEAKRLLDYFDRLKQQASAEEAEIQEPLEFSTEELLGEVERFLKRTREEEEGN